MTPSSLAQDGNPIGECGENDLAYLQVLRIVRCVPSPVYALGLQHYAKGINIADYLCCRWNGILCHCHRSRAEIGAIRRRTCPAARLDFWHLP